MPIRTAGWRTTTRPRRPLWVTAENEVTQNYLSQIPFRDKIHDRLTELWNYPKYGVPSKHGDYFFFFENDGLQNQSVLYRQKSLDGPAEVFLDPNKLSDDGTVALSDVSFSKDGKYCAYAAASSGSDWVEIRVMDVATRELLPDVIRWVKFSGRRLDPGRLLLQRLRPSRSSPRRSSRRTASRKSFSTSSGPSRAPTA